MFQPQVVQMAVENARMQERLAAGEHGARKLSEPKPKIGSWRW